jgi:hypothetical protein
LPLRRAGWRDQINSTFSVVFSTFWTSTSNRSTGYLRYRSMLATAPAKLTEYSDWLFRTAAPAPVDRGHGRLEGQVGVVQQPRRLSRSCGGMKVVLKSRFKAILNKSCVTEAGS